MESTAVCLQNEVWVSEEELHRYDILIELTNKELSEMSVEEVCDIKGVVFLVDFQTRNVLAKFIDGQMVSA